MQRPQISSWFVSRPSRSSIVVTLPALMGWLSLGGTAVAQTKPAVAPLPLDDTPSAEGAASSSGSSTALTDAGPTPPPTATSTSASTGRETTASIKNESQTNVAPDGSRPFAEPPAPPPPGVEPIPATVATGGGAPTPQPPAPYMQHLGPESFPGRLRGLYGGSLWLEPSFDGLQWPYLAHTGVGVSGNFWVDSGYESIKRDLDEIRSSSMYFMQGRGVLRVTPTYVRGRFFVQGQAELVCNLCQAANSGAAMNPDANTVCMSAGTFSTDDLWIRVGHWNIWDLKVGRFEAWEVYHLGMGLEPYTLERMGAGMFGLDTNTNPNQTSPQLEAPSLYGVNYLHDRPTDGLASGYAALHAYVTPWLRFEELVKLGTDNYRNDKTGTGDTATGNAASTYVGDRLSAILDVGSSEFKFKLKIGGEYQKRTPITEDAETVLGSAQLSTKAPVENTIQKGFGASAQFVIYPLIEFGLNGAIGRQEYTNSSGNNPNGPGYEAALPRNFTTKSAGGFANLRLADLWLAGLGVNWTEQSDSYHAPLSNGGNSNAPNYTSHLQAFAAVQYLLGGQLFIKAVFGYAKAYFQASDPDAAAWNNYLYSGRIRLMYLY
jgi:hypothetical protein